MSAIERLACSHNEFNDIYFSDQSSPRNFSSYIKASVSIRKQLNTQNELNLALVFPNSQNIITEFLVFEILRAIHSNEIQANYNVENFSIGEKVSVGKATLIFKGKSEERVFLQCSDVDKVGIPIKLAPILQKTKSKQLSSISLFNKERKRLESSIGLLSSIASNKTHMDKTIVFINLDSSMADIIEDLSKADLNGQSLKDLLYITKLVSGKPENIFSTRDSGISPLLCASDFVDLMNSDMNNHIHSIILKYSKRIENNIPFIQSLFELKIPITMIMDCKDYMESSIMSSFKVWIWDKDNIRSLSPYGNSEHYKYISNCANQDVKYEILEDTLINDCFIAVTKAFGMIRKELESFEGYMFIIDLYQMVLDLVRSPYIYTGADSFSWDSKTKLQTITDELEEKRNYLAPDCYDAFELVIRNLSVILSDSDYCLSKGKKLRDLLVNLAPTPKTVYLIIPDNINRQECSRYIESFNSNVLVLRTSEFLEIDASNSFCIIMGWLPRKQMLQLLYSYNSQQITILLYSAENLKWRDQANKTWRKKLFASNRLHLDTKDTNIELSSGTTQDEYDDYDEEESFKRTILLSRHRKYREQESNTERAITVEASSIEFLSNQFMFVSDKHKMLIVDSTLSKVHSYQIKDIKEGDYLVIRKSSRDIIREEADRILFANGFINARDIASEWKPLLEDLFWEYDKKYTSLYSALKSKGCSVIIQTFRMWINEPEMIMMDSINDLESIVELSTMKTLHSTKEIYDCGMLVREAHKEAGKTISEKLRMYLIKNKPTDLFNSTIDMDIPDVGAISMMKITGISHEKETIETKYIHRLLS